MNSRVSQLASELEQPTKQKQYQQSQIPQYDQVRTKSAIAQMDSKNPPCFDANQIQNEDSKPIRPIKILTSNKTITTLNASYGRKPNDLFAPLVKRHNNDSTIISADQPEKEQNVSNIFDVSDNDGCKCQREVGYDSKRQEAKKPTNTKEAPAGFTPDEGVCSPINAEYEYDEDVYYREKTPLATDNDEEQDDEEGKADALEQNDELTNLSRQSMMPIHELVAYYQYIQQGHGQKAADKRESLSRQSSGTSAQTVKIGRKSTSEDAYSDTTSLEHNGPPNRLSSTASDNPNGSIIQARQVDQLSHDAAGSDWSCHDGQIRQCDESSANDITKAEQVTGQTESDIKPHELENPQKDKRRIRANVVLELINSERDFVKHLHDVVEGYLYPARRHPEIFTGERINTIFANIEQLYEFQRRFLDCLELKINWDDLADSRVGNCFLEHEKGFEVYQYYCNNHPNASSELEDLYTRARFVKFFEACRLLQNMIDISLDGFLLTPIQKICKYPLQLKELLKNTDREHPDFLPVADALESMRNCANLANERKRRIEALADVMSFQEKVENWFGPKLCDTSSILIHSGEVSKMGSHNWSHGVQLYLFDHLLLHLQAKKDLLKSRNSLILKARINMDHVTKIEDADEFKAKRSFKLLCSETKKWFVFTTRSEKEKDEWIRAFERERSLVETDEAEGFHITDKEIGVARRTLQNRKHSRSARYRLKRPDTAVVDQLDLDDANAIMNRTLSLPSCIHPSHVMNFVEDSRVISSSSRSKKQTSTSPPASSRSPQPLTSSQQHHHNQHHHLASDGLDASSQHSSMGSGNWFKRIGSKKLVRSQVYNVNGAAQAKSQSNLTTGTFVDTGSSTASEKYDRLEKRHRDHMISEQQARLYRLNNDLPTSSVPVNGPSSIVGSPKLSRLPGATAVASRYRGLSPQLDEVGGISSLDFRALSLSGRRSGDLAGATAASEASSQNRLNSTIESSTSTSVGNRPSPAAANRGMNSGFAICDQQPATGSYEATVVLSSGRVVRVREDAV